MDACGTGGKLALTLNLTEEMSKSCAISDDPSFHVLPATSMSKACSSASQLSRPKMMRCPFILLTFHHPLPVPCINAGAFGITYCTSTMLMITTTLAKARFFLANIVPLGSTREGRRRICIEALNGLGLLPVEKHALISSRRRMCLLASSHSAVSRRKGQWFVTEQGSLERSLAIRTQSKDQGQIAGTSCK
jgi:hypothetical protein